MARPTNPKYTLGKISFKQHPTREKEIQARGYYVDGNLVRREITARGKSEAGAERELKKNVGKERDRFRGGDSLLSSETRLARAAEVWLDWKRREKKRGKPLASQTLKDYEGYVARSIQGSALANLPLAEANSIGRIEAWLERIADERGETAARQSKKVLSGILGLAERRGAIPASVISRVQTPGAKPGSTGDRRCVTDDCDFDCGKRHLDTRRAFTVDEAVAVQAAADGAKADIGDLAAFLFGTGVRIAEALHNTEWADVDFDARTVRVRGTKTAQADRILVISEGLVDRLAERASKYGDRGLVFGVTYFHSKVGEPRDRNNVSKALRRVFASADVRWAGTHTFRRTVATWLDQDGAPLAEIANQLGHADTNVTAGYLGRTTQPTRAADVMVLPRPGDLRLVSGE